jgi:hypothetical protein
MSISVRNHVDPFESSGTSPTRTTPPSLSAEEIHLFAEAMERIFNEPALVTQSEGKAVAR